MTRSIRIVLCAAATAWPAVAAQSAETRYAIDRPCLDLVRNLYAKFSDERPAGFSRYLPKIFVVDLKFQFTAYPKQHYYRFDTWLRRPVGRVQSLHKSLEIWAEPDRTVIRNRLEIVPLLPAMRCKLLSKVAARIGQRMADEAAGGVLALEDAAIRRLAN